MVGVPSSAVRGRAPTRGPGGGDTPDPPGGTAAEVRVLGPVEVAPPGGPTIRPSAAQRRLLARLAVSPGAVVTLDQLTAAVWAQPPRTARAALHNQISKLRARTSAQVVVTDGDGYTLGVHTDLQVVEDLAARAAAELRRGTPAEARELATAALRRWRGAPFAELEHVVELDGRRREVAELRRSLEDLRLDAALVADDLAWAVAEGQRLTVEEPFDERRWELLALALERSGRRGDALAALDRARRVLRAELGVEPGPTLVDLERRILVADPRRRSVAGARVIGREAELSGIREHLERSGLVHVVGEPGSGKSTLLDAVAADARAAGWVVARAGCAPHPASAVAVLLDVLESVGGRLDLSLGPVEGFRTAVAEAAARRPVLVLVDDVHHAGPTTCAALVSAARTRDVRVLWTSDGTRAHHAAVDTPIVELAPLDDDQVAALVRAAAGGAVADAVVARIVALAGGNPRLVDLLVAGLESVDPDPATPVVLPATLADQLRGWLDQLDAAARNVVEVVAVAGGRVGVDRLTRLVDPSAAEGAVRVGLLQRHQRDLGFRHGILREMVLTALPAGRRVELHHAVGLDLRSHGGAPGAVAHHLLAAAELDPPAAYEAAWAAAAAAARLGAHGDAVEWYERAADVAAASFGPRNEHGVAARIRAADERRLAGDPHHEVALLAAAEAAEQLGSPALLADAVHALLQLGATSASGAGHERALELADQVHREVEDPERRAVLLAASSLALSMAGRPGECRSRFLEAERMARRPEMRRQVLPFAYLGLGRPADLEARDRAATELLDLAVAADDPVAEFEAHHLSFSTGVQRADGERVRGALARMEELVDRVGDVGRRWQLLYQRAALAHLEDDLSRAEALSEAALRLFTPVSPSRAFAAHGGQLLALRWAQGRAHELAPLLGALVEEQPGVPAWHAALSLALLGEDPEAAARHAEQALETVDLDFTWMAAHLVVGRVLSRAGGAEIRRKCRQRLELHAGTVCWQGTCAYGPVDTALAELAGADGDHEAAEAHRARARSVARRLGAPVFLRELSDPPV